MKCRHCGSNVTLPFVDLGSAPPSNAYLTATTLQAPEKWYPLRVLVCTECWLVQTEDYAHCSELFSADYAYFSSFSEQWLGHAREYLKAMIERFGLNAESHVVEVASNDGYLLQYVKEAGIPCLGIEPTASTAAASRKKGIEVIEEFFGVPLAARLVNEGKQADLMAANNVLAHVPDIGGFVAGFTALLKARGVVTFEFPHLMQLVEQRQFDTIYHEHFSYLSFTSVDAILHANGLRSFDVEELPTHGGSLRVFAQRAESDPHPESPRVKEMLRREAAAGLTSEAFYKGFQEKAERVKNGLVAFLLEARRTGKRVAAYGAAAKGNTLLNFAGIRRDLLPFVVDRNPSKQGKFLPGSRIPILAEQQLIDYKPDYVLILPWNLKSEIVHQLDYIRAWGGRFVTAVPDMEVA